MRRSSANSRSVAGLVLVASLVIFAGTPRPACATPFVHEIVDPTNFSGYYSSLVLDSQDRPHIAYQDGSISDLRYARKVGNAWFAETVDATGSVGGYSSLALDASGNPRIAYRDVTNGRLKYAAKNGGIWTTEVADAGPSAGSYASMKLDAAGNPRISYLDGTNVDLKFAQKNGGIWTTEIVDGAATNVGYYTSLALDAAGRPHIAYFDNSTDDLRYAVKNGGVWTTELVDAIGFVGGTSLALDDQGNPRIAYFDSTPSDLRYAFKTGGIWTLETVESTGAVGSNPSLQINDAGNARLSYCFGLSVISDLRYATRSGSTWTIETVDATGDVGYYTSLALDSQGNPKISYFDFSNGDLRLTDSAVHVISPSGGETWPVGSLRDVVWSGSGTVSIVLSADGGLTEEILVENVDSSPVTVRVPHYPSRFARIGIRRSSPLSTSFSDTLLTIQTSIALLSFTATPPSGNTAGVALSWSTSPGPEDLSGYEVERSLSASGAWETIAPLTRETGFADPTGAAGARYRLSAVNGLGEKYVLGEVVVAPQAVIAAWPLPYRGGELNVSFATASALGGGAAPGSLTLFDLNGRVVRTLARGSFAAGRQASSWDGRDANGNAVASGIYFLRSLTGGQEASLKVVVAR